MGSAIAAMGKSSAGPSATQTAFRSLAAAAGRGAFSFPDFTRLLALITQLLFSWRNAS